MQQEFTHDFMEQNSGCYDEDKLWACSFMMSEIVRLIDIINSEIPLKDKFWFVCKKLATKEQNKQIAIRVAEIVLPVYEARCPDNKAVRECIEATKLFITGHINIEELLKKRRASADAAYAAYASDAAAAAYASAAASDAAAAAYAAAAAAYAYASDAAAYASAAAAYSYASDAAAAYAYVDIKSDLLKYLKTFVIDESKTSA